MNPEISSQISKEGFLIVSNFLKSRLIEAARSEASHLSKIHRKTCIRNLRSKSKFFHDLIWNEAFNTALGPKFHPVRSILFDKTPDQNWPVAWHQDLTIAVKEKSEAFGYGPWSVKDGVTHVQAPLALLQEMVTFRIHLDQTQADNGALRLIPGSHRAGRIPSHQIATHQDTPPVTCEGQPGDLLIMSPLVLHASPRSQSPSHRRVLHFEFAPKTALHPSLAWHES